MPWYGVSKEPHLQPLSEESISHHLPSLHDHDVRLDITVHGFWEAEFLDVRVMCSIESVKSLYCLCIGSHDSIPAKYTGFPGIIPGFSVSSRYPGGIGDYPGFQRLLQNPGIYPCAALARAHHVAYAQYNIQLQPADRGEDLPYSWLISRMKKHFREKISGVHFGRISCDFRLDIRDFGKNM